MANKVKLNVWFFLNSLVYTPPQILLDAIMKPYFSLMVHFIFIPFYLLLSPDIPKQFRWIKGR